MMGCVSGPERFRVQPKWEMSFQIFLIAELSAETSFVTPGPNGITMHGVGDALQLIDGSPRISTLCGSWTGLAHQFLPDTFVIRATISLVLLRFSPLAFLWRYGS
jgi:hypothetical protein